MSAVTYATLTAGDYVRVQAKYPVSTGGLVADFTFSVKRVVAGSGVGGNEGTVNSLTYYSAASTLSSANFTTVNTGLGAFGLGTTTMNYLLTSASSTAPQLALSAGAGFAQWAFRNAGGNLYFATTTVAGDATTSTSALSIIGSSGLVTIGKDLIVTGNSTTTNATTTNFFSTTASTTNFYGAGLQTCQSNNVLTYDGAGKFGCEADDSGSSAPDSKWATTTSTLNPNAIFPNAGNNTLVGIGTSTPAWQLQIASSTGPQLTLSDPSTLTNDHWSFRNAGGNFYLTTSSASTFATSSISAFTIIGSTGNVGIGTTTPSSVLGIGGAGLSTDQVITIGSGKYAGISIYGDSDFGEDGGSFLSFNNNSGQGDATIGISSGAGGDPDGGSSLGSLSNALFLGTRNDQPVQFSVNNTVRMAVHNGVAIGVNYSNTFASLPPTNGLIVEGVTGISTTTPYYNLTVASTTGPQLSLSSGGGFAQWVFRNAGGNLYFATTTIAGTATSSVSALSIDANGIPTFPSLGGSTGCAQFSVAGTLSNTGSALCITL